MTTLEDIYRHYDEHPFHPKDRETKNISRGSGSDDEDYERGQVTGYVIPQYVNHMPDMKQGLLNINN